MISEGMIKLYLHALSGGEFSQIDHEDMSIVMFKPKLKFKGNFRRRKGSCAENPMHHPIMMFNNATGDATLVSPNVWTSFNAIDLLEELRKNSVPLEDEDKDDDKAEEYSKGVIKRR